MFGKRSGTILAVITILVVYVIMQFLNRMSFGEHVFFYRYLENKRELAYDVYEFF